MYVVALAQLTFVVTVVDFIRARRELENQTQPMRIARGLIRPRLGIVKRLDQSAVAIAAKQIPIYKVSGRTKQQKHHGFKSIVQVIEEAEGTDHPHGKPDIDQRHKPPAASAGSHVDPFTKKNKFGSHSVSSVSCSAIRAILGL